MVDGRMAKGGAGPLDGVRAVGRRQSPGPHSHGEETRLGFPYNGTPPTVLAGFKSGLWVGMGPSMCLVRNGLW